LKPVLLIVAVDEGYGCHDEGYFEIKAAPFGYEDILYRRELNGKVKKKE
jgi:hypothetical protein